jgi:RNA polymerase sigma-70 factor (ECF subfamily)
VDTDAVDDSVSSRNAFTDLYRSHLPAVRGQVRAWVPADEVDEIVSATFVTAWRKFDQIPAGAEKPWLLGVARNHCRNLYRTRRRGDALIDAVARAVPREAAEPNGDAPDAGDFEPLLRAMRSLTADEQELLALSVWHDLTPTEIATVLGIRQGTIRVRLHRARRRLEAEYARLLDEDGAA